MNSIRLVSAALALFSILGACGNSEDDDGPSGGAPASAGNPSANAGTGAGGARNSGGNGGFSLGGFSFATGGAATKEECLDRHFDDPSITPACQECTCACNSTAAASCDGTCWQLARCVRTSCAADPSNISCLTSNCSAFLSGALPAAGLSMCFSQCGTQCGGWFGSAGNGSGGTGGAVSGGNGGATTGGGGSGNGGSGNGGSGTAGSAGIGTDGGGAGEASTPGGAGGTDS